MSIRYKSASKLSKSKDLIINQRICFGLTTSTTITIKLASIAYGKLHMVNYMGIVQNPNNIFLLLNDIGTIKS